MEFKKNLLYEIYLNDNDSSDLIDIGFFIAQDDEYAVFQCVSHDGLAGGFLLIKIETIWNLQSNTVTCQGLQKLIKYHKTTFENLSFKTKNLKKEFLTLAKDTRGIVGIELRDSDSIDLFGFIESISDDYVTTLEITTDGYPDGNGQCRFFEITKVSMNANKHRKYKLLFEINSK
ncbi:MAG: hypothetical protein FWH03_06465 [Firmicutes bacterium]|nr:hypothetical protein [Bacillota bacterium]